MALLKQNGLVNELNDSWIFVQKILLLINYKSDGYCYKKLLFVNDRSHGSSYRNWFLLQDAAEKQAIIKTTIIN
jgi:hypothetical protein